MIKFFLLINHGDLRILSEQKLPEVKRRVSLEQQSTRKQGFGSRMKYYIKFEVQFFVGGSVVKIPACV